MTKPLFLSANKGHVRLGCKKADGLLTAGQLEVADVLVQREAVELHPLAYCCQIAPATEREREKKYNIDIRSEGRRWQILNT